VTLHFAESLDGRIATSSGAARWISGPEATAFAHELRAAADGVLVGSGTVLADDPQLTVRLVQGRQPLRIVLDARGRLPESAKLLSDGVAPTLHVTGPATTTGFAPPRGAHVEHWEIPFGDGGEGVDLVALLAGLRSRGLERLVVEGGRRVITAFLRARLVDRIVVTIAPIIVGAGIDAVGDLRTERIDEALRFTTRRVWQLGGDVLIELDATTADGGDPERGAGRSL
jgi:riboflavin-specific deaminase-like protein